MKKWILYTWFSVKSWVLFTCWKFFHDKEDHKALVELYYRKTWERRQMARYLAYLDGMHERQKLDPKLKFDPPDWFVGVVYEDWLSRGVKYEPKEETKNESDGK